MRRLLALALAVFFLAGANGLAQSERRLPFSTLRVEGTNRVPEPSARVIHSREEWQAFLKTTLGHSGVAPRIDFRNATVIALFAGEKPTGGYSLRVDKVTDDSTPGQPGRATVHYRLTAPSGDSFVTQALTYPYVIIRVNRRLDAIGLQPPVPVR